MEGEMEVQIPMDLHGRHNRTIIRQGIGGIQAEGEECAKGGVRLRGLCPWSGEGMAPPRLGEKAFPSESTCSAKGKTNPSRNLGG
jgi:hypothetical protein